MNDYLQALKLNCNDSLNYGTIRSKSILNDTNVQKNRPLRQAVVPTAVSRSTTV